MTTMTRDKAVWNKVSFFNSICFFPARNSASRLPFRFSLSVFHEASAFPSSLYHFSYLLFVLCSHTHVPAIYMHDMIRRLLREFFRIPILFFYPLTANRQFLSLYKQIMRYSLPSLI